MAPLRRYKEIEEISGQSCGVQYSGGVNFACTPDRWQYLRNEWAKHRTMGIDSTLLTPAQVKEKCPPLNVEAGETTGAIMGGLFDQNEGYLDCAGVTCPDDKTCHDLVDDYECRCPQVQQNTSNGIQDQDLPRT